MNALAGVVLFMLVVGQVSAGTFFVASAGNDAGTGGITDPWRTLMRGVAGLAPGDTLFVRTGIYDESLVVTRSGIQGSPIVIQAYPGEYVEIRGRDDNDIAVAVVTAGYVEIQGFTFRNQDHLDLPFDRSYWIQLTGAHITFRRNRVLADGSPFYNHDVLHATSRGIVVSGRSSLVEDCFVRGQGFGIVVVGPAPRFVVLRRDTVFATYQNNIDIGSTDDGSTGFHGTLIEHCVLDTSFVEDNIQFEVNYAEPGVSLYNRGTIIRGCILGNAAENAIDLKGAAYIVIEQNRIYGAAGDDDGPVGGNDTQSGSAIEVNANSPGSNIIVRQNVIWDNFQGASLAEGDQYYNNTFVNNRRTWEGSSRTTAESYGVRVFTMPGQHRSFINNILASQPNRAVLDWRMDFGGQFTQDHNLYYDPTGPVMFSHRLYGTVSLVAGLTAWQDILTSSPYSYLEGKESHSLEADPQFINVPAFPAGYDPSFDFRTSDTSPARDAGRPVAVATAPGVASTTIPVSDAGAFTDGFGIVPGDAIRINGGSPVRVVAVDYAANVLTTDRAETWQTGAGIHPAYRGSAPDIGAGEAEGIFTDTLFTPATGTFRFSSVLRQVIDNTTVRDSLQLLVQGQPLKALQFRLVTTGRTILRSVSRGSSLPVQGWWFFSNLVRGTVQEDGSVADTCSVVILGTGAMTLPVGTYEDLVRFSYDVVNTPSATPVTASFRLVDVVGACADGSNAGILSGSIQVVTIRNLAYAGDVNGDDRIDILDAIMVVDHILQRTLLTPEMVLRADTSPWPAGDGIVDARDLAGILDVVLKGVYPDGSRPSGVPGGGTTPLMKLADNGDQPAIVKMAVREGRVRLRLINRVPLRGMQWHIPGVSIDSVAGGSIHGFESNHWYSDTLGVRGVSYSSPEGVLPPGEWLVGEFDADRTVASGIPAGDVVFVSADGTLLGSGGMQIDQDGPGSLPSVFHLARNFPNPFNPTTTIRFSLAEPSHVLLRVYSVLGEEITRLIDRSLGAGQHEVVFDARGLSSGVYFYRLESGRNIDTQKMVLMR